MARNIQDTRLQTRTARLKLPPAKKPIFVKIGLGIHLGYRRTLVAGTWLVRVLKGGDWTKRLADADDYENANGVTVLDFWQAQACARAVARDDRGDVVTVADALDHYERDLLGRQGDTNNVARVRLHLTDKLASKAVAALDARELQEWKDGLTQKGLAAATANRIGLVLTAALNLAAEHDALTAARTKRPPTVTNRDSWRVGLRSIRGAIASRNVILTDDQVRHIVAIAYAQATEFGLLVEVAAVTGARIGQIRRLEVRDLAGDRLDMPVSKKGRGRKTVTHRPIPIPANLAGRLRSTSSGRATDAPLLLRPGGARWSASAHVGRFRRAVRRAGHDPAIVTANALRHSSIVRQILVGVPIRVVAAVHDTSVPMIERTYSRYINDHADAMIRGALLDGDFSSHDRSIT
jgi:integrase